MIIWHLRHERGHERAWGRQKALAEVWKDEDFRVIYPEDLPELRGKKADLAIVCGRHISAAIRRGLDFERQVAFRVYIPTWKRGPRDCKLQRAEIARVKYHLVIPDQTMFLDEYRRVHERVFYVERGFDPKVFYPGPEEEKTREIVFCGNFRAYGRRFRLERLRDAHPGQVEWRRLKYRKLPGYLRSAKIGWNQILRGPPTHKTCLNYRVWEVVGSGALLLCSYSVDIPLIPSVHYAGWDSETDMMRKAKHFLENDDHRRAVAKAGYEEALAKHTWHHRALAYKEIIEAYL